MFQAFRGNSQSDALQALNSSMAMIEFSPQGDILTANDIFLETTGYRLSEITGRHHSLFCEPAYAQSEAYRRFWADLAAGHPQTQSFARIRKDGSRLWLQASYMPVRNHAGKVVRVMKVAFDITAAKETEIDAAGKIDALGRSQAIIEFSPDGQILNANENFLKVMGYSARDLKGQNHRLFCEPEYAGSADYARFWADLRAGEFKSANFKRLAKGGRLVYIQATYNPIVDEAGQVVKVVKFAVDTTAEIEKRLNNDQLSVEINTDLGDVVTRIVTANEMVSGAAGASTETGSIVNSVAAAAEELRQSVQEISQNMSLARNSVETAFAQAGKVQASAGRLTDSATAMSNVVTFIQDIASQINLLALNATIESARAGEAGKGFAVVASEVKSLANQSAASSARIAQEIASMQTISTDVAAALEQVTSLMTSVLDNVVAVASAIEQQNTVTSEISSNMHSAVGAVGEIEHSLNHISTAFASISEASGEVKRRVETLVA
ncbi:MAG: PAS domain-containing methyl-accepting chemotaxis protein [Asticcacaulis sp.]